MTEKKEKQAYRIGIDTRLLGTAQAAGIGRYTEELVRHLLKYDNKNEYYLFTTTATTELPVYAPNLNQVKVNFPHYSFREQLLYPSILQRAKLDLIHYTNFNSPILFSGAPSVVTVHDLTLWFFAGRKHKGWLQRFAYKLDIQKTCQKAKHIIAVSLATKKDIIKYLGIEDQKISVIHLAPAKEYKPSVDPVKLESLKRKFNINKSYLIYVGQWREHKNIIRLMRAFSLFKRRYGLDYQLVLVGKTDKTYTALPAIIKELNLANDVVMTGYVPDADLPCLYSSAELFVFPSLYEGFGLPPLEAMACGTPVVASNVSSLPEVLGDAARYFDPLDIEAMAKTMAEVAKSFSLKHQMKLKGLNWVKRYSFDTMAKATFDIYQQVLKDSSVSSVEQKEI
ncbi:glycosyltransferase family 4 protein [Patescibacteria group bacterium]|nr:glycosyltransferase family 4 protein [Patescibacteria group bacterium]